MPGLVYRVLDESLWDTICDYSDISYFQNLFHKSFPKVIVESEVLSL